MENKNIRRRLLPSKRPKKRYIAFQIVAEEKFDINQIIKHIQASFKQRIGEEAMQKSNFYFFKNRFNIKNRAGLIRTTPKYQKEMVDMINNVKMGNINLKFKTLGVSGTINKAYSKYIVS